MLNYQKGFDQDAILGGIDDLYHKAQTARIAHEREWYLNYCFYLGRQYTVWSDVANRLFVPPTPMYKVRLVSNQILPVHRRLKSRLMPREPVFYVLPANSDETSYGSAKIAQVGLKATNDQIGLPDTIDEIISQMLLFGTTFSKAYFNPSRGQWIEYNEYTKDDTGVPWMDDKKGEQHKDTKTGAALFLVQKDRKPVAKRMRIGEVSVDATSPFEIYLDHTAKKWKQNTHMMHCYLMGVDEARQKYNDKTIEPTKGMVLNQVEQQLLNILGSQQETTYEDMVHVKEYWEVPSQDFEKGRLIILNGPKIVDDDVIPDEYLKNEYADLPFPFVSYNLEPLTGSPYALSLIEPLREPQKELNRSRSQIVEHKNLFKGKLMVPQQCQISDNAYNDVPGEKITYVGGPWGKPEIAPIPPLPAFIFMHIDYIKQDINNLSGQGEISQGRPPKGVRSGIAFAQMLEQDETMLFPAQQRLKYSLQALGNMELSIIKHRYTEKRMLKAVGKDNLEFLQDFMGSEQIDQAMSTYCEFSTNFSQNKAVRSQQITALFDRELLSKEEARQALELGQEELFTKERQDVRIARMENDDLVKGIMHEVMPYQNHVVHIQEHNDYRNTTVFEKLPEVIKTVFNIHLAAHEDALTRNFIDTDVKLKIQKQVGPNLAVAQTTMQNLNAAVQNSTGATAPAGTAPPSLPQAGPKV